MRRKGVPPPKGSPIYTETQVFNEWLEMENDPEHKLWIKELTPCPKNISVNDGKPGNPDSNEWEDPHKYNVFSQHGDAVYEMRSKVTPGGHSNQCSYDKNGNIIEGYPGGGTADNYAGKGLGHYEHDLKPYWLSKKLNRQGDYYLVRPEVIEE